MATKKNVKVVYTFVRYERIGSYLYGVLSDNTKILLDPITMQPK